MVKQLSTGSGWIWLDTVSPGVSETNVSVGNLWLNTSTQNLFVCKDATGGAQVWDEYPIVTVTVAKGGTGATSLTGVLTGNGTSAVTANAVTQHGVLLGSASNAVSSLAVAATGTVLAGTTGADPAFTATPSVTSITLNGGTALGAYLEQQTWTPTIVGGTAAGAGTYTTQSGYYTRIGNMIFCQATIVWTAHTGTGDMYIGGYPFACRNSSNYDPEGIVNPINIPLPGGATSCRTRILSGASTSLMFVLRSNNTNDPVQMNATGTVHLTIAYLT